MPDSDSEKIIELHAACMAGDICKLQVLMTALISTTNILELKHPHSGWSVLHSAARSGRRDILQLVLDSTQSCSNFSIDIEISRGKATPLWVAAHGGVVETSVYTALLDLGANINHKNDQGQTPCFAACVCGHFRALRALKQASLATRKSGERNAVLDVSVGDGWRPPLHAVFTRCLEARERTRHFDLQQIAQLVTELSQCGPSFKVDQVDGFGHTALLLCCDLELDLMRKGDAECLERLQYIASLLLQLGSDSSIRAHGGDLALLCAFDVAQRNAKGSAGDECIFAIMKRAGVTAPPGVDANCFKNEKPQCPIQ